MADDAPDGRHQDFTKGDGKLLQLGFQDGQLTGKVVLHGRCHRFCSAVAVVDGIGELVDILRGSVHQGEEAGHGVLAHKGLCSLRLLGFRQAGERGAAIGEDIGEVAHGAVRISGSDGDVSDGFTGNLHFSGQIVHDGTKRGTGLRGLDTGIGHQADCLGSVLSGETECTGDGRTVFEGLAHHGDVGVGIAGGRRKDIREVPGVLSGEAERGQCICDDV